MNVFKMNICNRSEVLSKGVVELFHRNFAVTVLVESSEEGVLFLLGAEDVESLESI